MPLDILLYVVIIAIAVSAYLLGHRDGYRKGYDSGFVRGNSNGVQRWQQLLEYKRGPGGLPVGQKDALLGVTHTRPSRSR